MLYQVAIIHELHGLPYVDAGRPAGDITGDTFAAIQYVQPLYPGLALSVAHFVGEHLAEARLNATVIFEIVIMAVTPRINIPRSTLELRLR